MFHMPFAIYQYFHIVDLHFLPAGLNASHPGNEVELIVQHQILFVNYVYFLHELLSYIFVSSGNHKKYTYLSCVLIYFILLCLLASNKIFSCLSYLS